MLILVWLISLGVTVLVGLFVLGRYRHRSRKATTLGIYALCGYAAVILLMLAPAAFELRLIDRMSAWYEVVQALLIIGSAACVLLLVVAVVIDRRA